MASSETVSGHRLEGSLFRAADALASAIDAPPDAPAWDAGIRAALRRATLAVEARLDSLLAADGTATEIALNEPRLLPALDRLEGALAGLLVDVWEARGQPSALGPGFIARLARLVDEMRHIAGSEYALVLESLNATGPLD